MYAILCPDNCQARKPNPRTTRLGGRSCSGTIGGIWCANCAPPAPAPGPSCGCPSAWRDSPLARICSASPASCALLFRFDPGILRVNGKPLLVGDGIKIPKAGRKMPGVKKLHQQSESNNKPEYIFGHSCQAVAVLTQALSSVFALPLACRIHEGTVFSNRDHRTLLDKMILLLDSLDLNQPFYFVADAYYASGKIVRGLLAHGNHLVTRVKSNSVAFFPATPPPPRRPRRRGRPAKYGKKIKVAALLKEEDQLQEAPSPVYGEQGVTLRFRAADL